MRTVAATLKFGESVHVHAGSRVLGEKAGISFHFSVSVFGLIRGTGLQELQESDDAGLVLLSHQREQVRDLIVDELKEPIVMIQHRFESARAVVVEIGRRVFDAPERWDLEVKEIVWIARDQRPTRIRKDEHCRRAIRQCKFEGLILVRAGGFENEVAVSVKRLVQVT